MAILLSDKKEVEEYLDKTIGVEEIKAREVAFVFGAGVNIAMGLGVSWKNLNIELVKVLEREGLIDKHAHMQFSSGSNLSNFDESVISEFIKKKFQQDDDQKYQTSILEILQRSAQSNANIAKYSIAHSKSLIITTNYLLHKDIENERETVVDAKTDRMAVGKKTIYVHGKDRNIVLSKNEFVDKYYKKNKEKNLSDLLWTNLQDKKIIFIIGASGKDYDFFTTLAKVNNSAKKIMFSEDYFANPKEAEVFDEMMKTLFQIHEIVHYPKWNNLSTEIISEIGQRLDGNKMDVFEIVDFLKIEKQFKKNSPKQNKIDWIYNEACKKGRFSIDTFAEFISNLTINFKTFKEMKSGVFIQQIIFEHFVNKNKATENHLKWFVNDDSSRMFVDSATFEKIFDKFFNNENISKQTKMKLLEKYISSDWRNKDYIFTVEDYCSSFNIKRPLRLLREDKMIKVNIKNLDDIFSILSAYIRADIWHGTELLNIDNNTFGGIAYEIRKNIVDFLRGKVLGEEEILSFAKNAFNSLAKEEKEHAWVLLMLAFFKWSKTPKINKNKIWIGPDDAFASCLPYLRNNNLLRIEISDANFSQKMLDNPESYFYYGMISKNSEWLRSYQSKVKNGDVYNKEKIERAISNLDLEQYLKAINESRRTWSSRTFGDGKIDPEEKTLASLIKQDHWDFWHVYESWINNPNLEIDDQMQKAFETLKSINLNNYLTIIEEATEELSPFVKKRVKEIIELGAQERKLSTQDVEFYLSKFVDVKNDLKIYKKTNFEKNEPFAALYQLSLNSFCDLLEKQYFDKKNLDEKARNDNKNLISKFIDFENMNLTTCLCLISISWYWDPKYFIKSLEKFPDNKIEIINVITSTVHFWDVETNSIIADTVLSEPNHPLMIKKSDGVSVHNFVTIFYLAKKSEKLLNFAWAHESLVGLAFSWKTDDENQKIFNLLLNGKLSIKKLLPRSILDCEKTYSEIKEPLKKVITQWGSQNQAIHDFNWFFEITSKWEESQNDDEMMEIFNVLSEKVKYGHIFISDDLKEKIEKNRFWRIHKSRFGPN